MNHYDEHTKTRIRRARAELLKRRTTLEQFKKYLTDKGFHKSADQCQSDIRRLTEKLRHFPNEEEVKRVKQANQDLSKHLDAVISKYRGVVSKSTVDYLNFAKRLAQSRSDTYDGSQR